MGWDSSFVSCKNPGNSFLIRQALTPIVLAGRLTEAGMGMAEGQNFSVWAAKLGRSGGFKDFNFCIYQLLAGNDLKIELTHIFFQKGVESGNG